MVKVFRNSGSVFVPNSPSKESKKSAAAAANNPSPKLNTSHQTSSKSNEHMSTDNKRAAAAFAKYSYGLRLNTSNEASNNEASNSASTVTKGRPEHLRRRDSYLLKGDEFPTPEQRVQEHKEWGYWFNFVQSVA